MTHPPAASFRARTTGAAISPTPPDTRRAALPTAPRSAACMRTPSLRRAFRRPPYVRAPGRTRHGTRYLRAAASPRLGTVTGGRSATASRRKACRPLSSLRKLVRWRPARPPPFSSPQRDGRRRTRRPPATSIHTRSRSRRLLRKPYRHRHRPAARRYGMIFKSPARRALRGGAPSQATGQPPASGPVRSPPLRSRSGITAEGVPVACLTAQACSLASGTPAAVFSDQK